MSAQSKQEVNDWFQTVVNQFVGKNIKQYRARILLNAVGQTGAFGVQCDIKPFEGKVVMTAPYLVVKEGPSTFAILSVDAVDQMPGLDDKVKVTPYARRDFTGRFGYEPKTESYGGIQMQVFSFGGEHTELPIKLSDVKDTHMVALIRQLNTLPAPDGFRNLAQILADANATGFELKTGSTNALGHPSLTCQVATQKHVGELSISLHLGRDTYTLAKRDGSGAVIKAIEWVHYDELGQALVELIDDGAWQITRVDILQQARGRSARLAA